MIAILFSLIIVALSKTITTNFPVNTSLFSDDVDYSPTYSDDQVQELVNLLAFGVLREYNLDITTPPQKIKPHVYRITDSEESELALVMVLQNYERPLPVQHDFASFENLEGSLCLCTVFFRESANIEGTLVFGQYNFEQDGVLQKTIIFKTDPKTGTAKLSFTDESGQTGTGDLDLHDDKSIDFKFTWD